jgi:hypothetical protein
VADQCHTGICTGATGSANLTSILVLTFTPVDYSSDEFVSIGTNSIRA